MRGFIDILKVAVAFGIVASTSLAKADVGTPIQCTSCSSGWTTTTFNRRLGVDTASDITLRRYALEYANNIDTSFYVVNNAYTSKWQFHTSAFQTESGFDWLGYKRATDPNPMSLLTGTVTSGHYGPDGGGQSSPVLMRFYSDPSVTFSGVVLDSARTCCNTTRNDGVLQFPKHSRITGHLYGTGDTVYMSFPGNSTPSIHESLVMWGRGTPGSDFDIYVRCGAKPTTSDWHSSSSSQNEAIHFGDSYTTTCASSWYVAVTSYSGSGTFDLMWTTHKSAQHKSLRAGINFSASSSQLDLIRAELTAFSRLMYGATEGNLYIADVTLYNNVPGPGGSTGDCAACGGVTCDMCFGGGGIPGSSSTGCGGFVRVSYSPWATDPYYTYTYLVHEFGHTRLCVADEYCGSPDPRCNVYPTGVPAGMIYNQSNHCPMSDAQDANIHNFCTSRNFGRDSFWSNGLYSAYYPPYPNTMIQASSCWDTAYGSGKMTYLPTDTPDNYDFVDFAPPANWVGLIFN